MATAAFPVAGGYVCAAFAGGGGAVMAGGAGRRYVAMVEMCRHPGQRAVAATTFHVEGGDMVDRFAGSRAAVVATGTGLGHMTMIEDGRCPALGGMAVIAVVGGGDVSGGFTTAQRSVMAIAAADADIGVVHAGDGVPGIHVVAAFAGVAGGDVFIVLAGGHDTAATAVTATAGARGTLEYALGMTAGAVGVDVAAGEREGRHAVIKAFPRLVGVVDCNNREQQCDYQQCADG